MSEEDDDATLYPEPERETQLPRAWTETPDDPSPNDDLGYELVAWERITVADDEDRVLFVPDGGGEDPDGYLLADAGLVCDLGDRR